MKPTIVKQEGATYFDNDPKKVQYDRGGLSDNEYEAIIRTKNTTISELTEALGAANTALNAVKYSASVSGANASAVFKDQNTTDVTANVTNLAAGVNRNSVLEVTVTAAEGYTISSVEVNSTAVTLTDGKFNLTMSSNKAIVITAAQIPVEPAEPTEPAAPAGE